MRNVLTPVFQLACSLACLLALAASVGPLAHVDPARGDGHRHGIGAAPARAAKRIYVDLATGQLREPTAAELAADAQRTTSGLRASQKQALPGATSPADSASEVHLADGTVGVRPARQYLHTIVLCRQADGSFGERCADAGGAR